MVNNNKELKDVRNYKFNGVEISVFTNKVNETEYKSFVINKNYKDKDDNWNKTNNFGLKDLLYLNQLITEVLSNEFIRKK